jgi:hypothetical protein
MILDEGALGALLQKVFSVYAGFWTLVLVVLFLGIGRLLKRYDQTGKGH